MANELLHFCEEVVPFSIQKKNNVLKLKLVCGGERWVHAARCKLFFLHHHLIFLRPLFPSSSSLIIFHFSSSISSICSLLSSFHFFRTPFLWALFVFSDPKNRSRLDEYKTFALFNEKRNWTKSNQNLSSFKQASFGIKIFKKKMFVYPQKPYQLR